MTDFIQTRFLGASIRNFDSHIGWGSQTSTLSVNLAEDPAQNDRFTPPLVGQSVFFNYQGWTFGGILQSWRKTRGEDGNSLYSVNVEDPRDILNGVTLIVSNYSGTTSVVPNLYNIYGYIEDEDGFGAANINDNGISWTKVRDAFNTLQNTHPIRLRGETLRVDLTGLPAIPDSHRVSGPSLSLMDFIADICAAGSRDFFFTYDIDLISGYNTLTLITIDRSQAASSGAVTLFLETLEEFNSSELGMEFRNEATSKFLVGGAMEKLHATPAIEDDDITNDNFPDGANNTVWPYFGLKEDLTGIRVLTPKALYTGNNPQLPDDAAIGAAIQGGQLAPYEGGLIFDTYVEDFPGLFAPPDTVNIKMEKESKIAGLHTVEFYNPAVDEALQNANVNFSRWYNRATRLYKTDLNELRAALGGQDAWETYLQLNAQEYTTINDPITGNWIYCENTHYNKTIALLSIGLLNVGFFDVIRNAAANNANVPFDQWMNNTFSSTFFTKSRQPANKKAIPIPQAEQLISEVYQTIQSFAQEYFGRKYLVSVPSVGAKFDPEETTTINDFRGDNFTVELNGKIITSLEPSDGGFVDETEFNAAIQNKLLPRGFADLMTDSGKIQCYARFLYLGPDGKPRFKLSSLPENSYVEDDRYIYIKCDVDPQLVFLDVNNVFSPRAVVTLPGYVAATDATETWMRIELIAQIQNIAAANLNIAPFNVNNPILKQINDLISQGLGADLLNEPTESMFVIPSMIVVPLKSNTETYGPWYSTGADGKTDFEVDGEMVPWNFGSYELMHAAANAKVSEGASQQQDGETGSVTFAGVPVINIGSLLISGGPYVTDVNVDIGENGARTTYSFATWTKQFGTIAKEMIEDARKQRLLNNRNAQRNFRNNKKQIAQFQPKPQVGGRNSSKRNKSNSSHPIIAAQKTGDKNNIVIAPPYNVADKLEDLENKYVASLDTLFTPFSTNFDDEVNTLHFEHPSGNGRVGLINSSGLNPYSYPHNFMLMTRADPDHDEDTLYIQNSGEDDPMGYKAIAHRAPMVLAGWGFDTAGKPVPAKADNPNEFADDYRVNTNKWKVGPLDARWDNNKKIWIASGGQLKKAQLESSLRFNGSGLANFYEYNPQSGIHIGIKKEYVFDWLLPSGAWLSTGTKCWLSEDNGRHYVVNAECIREAIPIRY